MNRKLMLISNSFHGQGYLEHCADAIRGFLGDINTKVIFIPYALKDWDQYAEIARKGFSKMGIHISSIHEWENHVDGIAYANAIFIGGGNTFRLLNTLNTLFYSIRKRVDEGMPYLGVSAGANVAGPTIKTTNDMPIVYPPSFDALNLVPFQINPHYLDADPNFKHMGETREKRIAEFHEENDAMVIGMREGSWITVSEGWAYPGGLTGFKIFEKDQPPKEWDKQPIRLW